MDCVIELINFNVKFGNKCILKNINLSIPITGCFNLLGPVGSGKSTLLRTLAGINDASPSHQVSGTAAYLGQPLLGGERPAIVAQKTRLLMASIRENIICELPERSMLTLPQQRDICIRLLERAGLDFITHDLERRISELPIGQQRHIAILRTLASNPKLLLADEPTADIEAADAERILVYLKSESKATPIIVVTHNQKHAKYLGGYTALLVEGHVCEVGATNSFFNTPESSEANDFTRTGNCLLAPKPKTNIPIRESSKPHPSKAIAKPLRSRCNQAFGPRNFLWLKKGLLAGTPQPGIFLDYEYDLKALQRVGIKILISLTENPIDVNKLNNYGIENYWFPIKDMGAPNIGDANKLCIKVENYIQENIPVAFHCRAGMGRTGTMLAAQLIHEGYDAMDALKAVRQIEPRWVQSESQILFLEKFALEQKNCAKPY